ncbi:TPT-domain-containing protein [Xylogone sp. PMI_703]|nr:TPT-domain-containing protein [Xylogone sp. PMI_703]
MSNHPRRDSDVEAQKGSSTPAAGATEYEVPLHQKLVALSFYFFLSLGLTLQSKIVLQKVSFLLVWPVLSAPPPGTKVTDVHPDQQFAFPYLLTALHTGITALGCYGLALRGYIKPTTLGMRENMVLLAFSSLFTINIAISNVSLAMVSVAFHQILRSTVPVFTILIYRLYYGRSYSTQTYLSLIPIILGVGLVTYGDYYFTRLGFMLTLLGVVLAAIKTVVTNRLMTGSRKLPPLEFLLRMCPLAAVQSLLYAYFTGEGALFMKYVEEGHLTNYQIFALLSNAIIAFLLNISSFQTNKVAGALTMTVCGNVKQVLTVLLGIVLFNVKVGLWNGLGMVIALAGAAYYSKVELNKKKEQSGGAKASRPENPPATQHTRMPSKA